MTHSDALKLLAKFGGDGFHSPMWKPSVDVYRTASGWLLKFELAGVCAEDVRLEVFDRTVRLAGTRRDLMCGQSCAHHSIEIAYSSFERSVELPHSLVNARVNYQVNNGMLLVQIDLHPDGSESERGTTRNF